MHLVSLPLLIVQFCIFNFIVFLFLPKWHFYTTIFFHSNSCPSKFKLSDLIFVLSCFCFIFTFYKKKNVICQSGETYCNVCIYNFFFFLLVWITKKKFNFWTPLFSSVTKGHVAWHISISHNNDIYFYDFGKVTRITFPLTASKNIV